MEKGDFLVALNKSPKSQFLQCGEALMSIEKMELPEDQKQPKPAVQKYRDAKISYAEATKKTLQGNKQPQQQENKLPGVRRTHYEPHNSTTQSRRAERARTSAGAGPVTDHD